MPNSQLPNEIVTLTASASFIETNSFMELVYKLNASKVIYLRVSRAHFTKFALLVDKINREQPQNGFLFPGFEEWIHLNYVDIWHVLAIAFYKRVVKSGYSNSRFLNALRKCEDKCPWYISDGAAVGLANDFRILCNFSVDDEKWEDYVLEREKFLLVSAPY